MSEKHKATGKGPGAPKGNLNAFKHGKYSQRRDIILKFGIKLNCPKCGNINIRKYGKNPKGIQRYQCKSCGKTFLETIGTVFYYRHYSVEEIIKFLVMWLMNVRLVDVRTRKRVFVDVQGRTKVKGDTIRKWVREAIKHGERTSALLMANDLAESDFGRLVRNTLLTIDYEEFKDRPLYRKSVFEAACRRFRALERMD